MSELCRRLVPLLLLMTTSSVATAQGAKLLSMEWHGPNLVLRFSDSVSFHTDMAESDSNLTLRFAEPIESSKVNRASHGDLVAKLEEDGSTFRLDGDRRVGYSMLWGPWSHTLVIYTFNWDSLTFAEEQFHLGLIALEQNLPNVATEYLATARGADTGLVARRAEGVLGMVYARRGEDSLASLYLADPRDADAWGARSEVLRRSGDTAAAATAERQMADASDAVPGLADVGSDPVSAPADEVAEAEGPEDFLSGWRGITLLIVAGLLILIIATLFARRPPKSEILEEELSKEREEPPHQPVTERPVQQEGASESDVEISTPPPAPEEAERIISEEIPKPRGSSIHEIFSPAPDSEKTRSPLEGFEEESAPEETPRPSSRPAASRQADALRRRVQGESEETVSPTGSIDTPEEEVDSEDERESIISRARKMNVSRDYVELRRRLEKMRKR